MQSLKTFFSTIALITALSLPTFATAQDNDLVYDWTVYYYQNGKIVSEESGYGVSTEVAEEKCYKWASKRQARFCETVWERD